MQRFIIGTGTFLVLLSCSDWNRLQDIEEKWEESRDSTTTDSDAPDGSDSDSTGTPTDSGTETTGETDSTSDSITDTGEDSDTPSETESETDTSCLQTGCGDDNPVCDADGGVCVECLADEHCEDNFTCDTALKTCHTTCTPPAQGCVAGHYCQTDACLPVKASGAPCGGNDYECKSDHCGGGYCCASGTCCQTSADCAPLVETPICSTTFQCAGCSDENAPADGCALGYPGTPHCRTGGNTCVECNEHTDCYLAPAATPDEHRPYLSPLGACTPDHTCTCWVPRGDLTGNCTQCNAAGAGFVCERDFDDGQPSPNIHTTCLRKCVNQTSPDTEIHYGLRCHKRLGTGDYLWLPIETATCFSFRKFGTDCSLPDPPSDTHCSVDGSGDNGNNIKDGICNDFGGSLGYRCTYSCWDGADAQDNWCPEGCLEGGAFSRCDYTE